MRLLRLMKELPGKPGYIGFSRQPVVKIGSLCFLLPASLSRPPLKSPRGFKVSDMESESFGQYLRGLREERGKSLNEIAESTKIAVPNLESIEKDRYDLLPPRVFVKGFIRSYVQELGLDPIEVLQKFEDFTNKSELTDFVEEERVVFNKAPNSFFTSPWFTIILTGAGFISLVILLLTGVTKIVTNSTGAGARNRPSVVAAQPQGYDTSAGSGAMDTALDNDFEESARTQSTKKTLEIRATSNSWVRIEPDTGPAEEIVMAPGDIHIFTARESFYLQTGNAGGIKLRLNGKDMPVFGKSNQGLSITLP